MSHRAVLCCFSFCVLSLGCKPALSEFEKQESLFRNAQLAITPLHTPKKAAQPGDWLWEHDEPGQTYAEFVSQNASRSYERSVIYIQPLGPFTQGEERLVTDTEEILRIFFGKEVKRLPPLSLDILPKEAWRKNPYTEQTQILSTAVLNLLVPRLPKDALAMISFTATDLWPGEGWNFVFGQASFKSPVGIWSLARYGDPETEYTRALQRTIKVALHETGHMLGILHCIAYECGMNGTNSLRETDEHPMAFCPECERKLWWSLELDLTERYSDLISFAKEHDLKAEAVFWERSLGKVKSSFSQ